MPEASDIPQDIPVDIHLDPNEMSRLVRLDCPHELAFEWLAHLVACELCRDRLARNFPAESRRILDRFLLLHDTRGPAVEVHPSAYDRIFDRARVQGRREIPGRAIPW
jgi:hypothetical protein